MFRTDKTMGETDREAAIGALEAAPQKLREAVAGLTAEQLDTPYREGGWTLRQVVHHLPDSHMNSYIRCKWALTEDEPVIKPYFEDRWATLPDTYETPPQVSLALLGALHERWVTLFRALSAEDFTRTFVHPESGVQTLQQALAYYAWHSEHHHAQIVGLRQRRGW
jgi:uncharacterized damage-inducible protein DinB